MRLVVSCSLAYVLLAAASCAPSGPDVAQSNLATPEPASVATIAAPSSPQPTRTTEPQESKLESVDATWNRYTSHRLGFSMLVPRSMFRTDVSCYWNEDGGDFSYRPLAGNVPVVVIEAEDRVYITSKYLVALTEPTRVPSGLGYVTSFAGCEWRENTEESVAHRDYSSYIWEILVRPIGSDQDLEDLVDDYFGECFSVGEITPVEGRGYSHVRVVGDQKPIEESECLLRGMYVLLYSESVGRAATWKTGQMVHFAASEEYDVIYDQEMYESFEFLPVDW
jgi:hypothetical protein